MADAHRSARLRCCEQLEPGLSPASRALLALLLEHAEVTFDDDEGQWHCDFPAPEVEGEAEGDPIDCHLVIDSQPAATIPSGTPAPLAAFLAVCRGMTCGEQGNTGQLVLDDGDDGTLHTVGDDALSERACGFAYSPEICSPRAFACAIISIIAALPTPCPAADGTIPNAASRHSFCSCAL